MINSRMLFIIVVAALIWQCGSDPSKEVQKAYDTGDYSLAIKLIKEAQIKHKNDSLHQDLLALAYLYRGQDLYRKTRNIQSFAGNYEQAKEVLPAQRSEEFRKEYAELLTELAQAYSETRGETDLEKETFLENSISIVKMAIQEDSTNQKAADLLARIKQNNFDNLIKTAKDLYQKARKTGQVDLYYISESYLKQAAEFDPRHPEILDYMNRIKKSTMAVLNYRDGVSLAITAWDHKRDKFDLNVSIKNYTAKPLDMKITEFRLIDSKGNAYEIDANAMKQNELLGKVVMTDSRLDAQNPIAEGSMVFSVPDTTNIRYLSYKVDTRTEARKYFP